LENEFAAETIDAGKNSTKKPNATRNRKLLAIINDFSRQKRKRKYSPNSGTPRVPAAPRHPPHRQVLPATIVLKIAAVRCDNK
jgi:hypothetical protein